MKILIAPDSFKGSLSAPDAAEAIAKGIRRVLPDAELVLLPVADGGEGTLDALIRATGGSTTTQMVTGPLDEQVSARWGLLGDQETAIVELAEAAGLTQVPTERRNPKVTTTHGVGELLLAATQHPQVRRVIVGLGGSATNDGGAGLLTALGVKLRDASGALLSSGGATLAKLAEVETRHLRLVPENVGLLIACDVDNPLTGSRGASAIFGPQKGATPEDIALLDAALAHYAATLPGGQRFAEVPGAGAAGGTAFGLLWLFPNATLRPGIDLVLDAIGFDAHLRGASLVLTGEGRLDGQTLGGKALAGIARRAKSAGVPVGALVGGLTPDVDQNTLAETAGIPATLPIVPGPCTLEDAFSHAPDWLADAAERALRWMQLM